MLEETHYYPFGLPIVGLGSVDVPQNFKENRHKYQGNEYIKAIGLNWMDFQARQYDPQIGRFLGVDPLAASGGQDMFSPYAAMGNAPESTIDPNGEMFQPAKGATSFYAANDKLYRGDEGGPGSGGGGSGTGGDAIWAALSAFGLEGSANIIEYAAKKQQEAMTGAENNQDQAPVANGEGTNDGGDETNGGAVGASDPNPQQTVTNSQGLTLEGFVELSNINPVTQSGSYDCVYANLAMLEAKYGGKRSEKEIKIIAQLLLFAGPEGPSAQQIPHLAELLGFRANIIWDDGTKSNSSNRSAVWNSLRNDRAVMMIALNNVGLQHDRTVVRMEYWANKPAGISEFRTFVMDPAQGRIYQLPQNIFKTSILLYQIYK